MAAFNPTHKEVLDQMLLKIPGVRAGQMFGYPAYYAGKKLCACLYEEGVGLKLPQETVQQLLQNDTNVIPFQPLGKAKMREWVQINLHNPEEYKRYQVVFEESIRYVLSTQLDGKV